MLKYTVRLNGKPIADFDDESKAKKFMVWFTQNQVDIEQQLAFIDEAVLKSDMSEAKTIIKHIMELPNA